jgi:hypothetical protein
MERTPEDLKNIAEVKADLYLTTLEEWHKFCQEKKTRLQES